MPLDYIEHLSTSNHAPESHIIWLHGLGDTGNGWLSAVQHLHPQKPTRFILPHAPIKKITINGGYAMPGWYDIASMDFRDRGDEPGIRESAHEIQNIIDSLVKQGILSHKIFIAGFSQGGAIALHTALRCPYKLGGILALSTYLPLQDVLPKEAHVANKELPIAMMHGLYDNVIPLAIAEASYAYLKQLGYKVEWKTYPMAHEASAIELNDIEQWLNKQTYSITA
ncbi:MAG: carboxylesterase [Pseudomonadota bacterium]